MSARRRAPDHLFLNNVKEIVNRIDWKRDILSPHKVIFQLSKTKTWPGIWVVMTGESFNIVNGKLNDYKIVKNETLLWGKSNLKTFMKYFILETLHFPVT